MFTQPPAVSYITRVADIIVALGTRITAGVIMIASMSVTGCHGMHIPSSLTPGRPMGQLWTAA